MNEFRKRCECWHRNPWGGLEVPKRNCEKCQGRGWLMHCLDCEGAGMKQPGNRRCFMCEGTGLVGVKHEA